MHAEVNDNKGCCADFKGKGCPDMKEIQYLQEEEDQYMEEEEEDQDMEDDDSYSDEEEDSDEEEEASMIPCMFKSHHIVDLALTLKDDFKFVEVSGNILKYFRDGGDDVHSFSKMVNQVLEHKLFINGMFKLCQTFYIENVIKSFGHDTQSHKETVEKLSRVRNDPFFEKDVKGPFFEKDVKGGGKDCFLEEVVGGRGDPEIVVRGALSILIPYCFSEDELKNSGIWIPDPVSVPYPYPESDSEWESDSESDPE